MKHIIFLTLLLCSTQIIAQEPTLYDSTYTIPGEMPSNLETLRGVTGTPRGGIEITNQGTLRILKVLLMEFLGKEIH